TRKLRMVYGAVVAVVFLSGLGIGPLYSSPELALAIGNIFSFITGFKQRIRMTLKSKHQIGGGIYSFVFEPSRKFVFEPGQYLEWTSALKGSDTRGNRRYFTIASSPTENDVRLGVRFFDKPSTFKHKLLALEPNAKLLAGQLSGDFVMP